MEENKNDILNEDFAADEYYTLTDEDGHELKNIEFNNITLGDKEHPTEQTISLRLCKGITFKNITCL